MLNTSGCESDSTTSLHQSEERFMKNVASTIEKDSFTPLMNWIRFWASITVVEHK